MSDSPNSASDSCPGCGARISPARPPFCEFCGATLPVPAPAAGANEAELERRLAALREQEAATPKSSGSLGMLIVVVLVIGAVLVLGCCAFLGGRLEPPR
jgi:hypothetical protein